LITSLNIVIVVAIRALATHKNRHLLTFTFDL